MIAVTHPKSMLSSLDHTGKNDLDRKLFMVHFRTLTPCTTDHCHLTDILKIKEINLIPF